MRYGFLADYHRRYHERIEDLNAVFRHTTDLEEIKLRGEKIRAETRAYIALLFKHAFPNRWYVFLVQRPIDVDGGVPAWPLVLRDRDRAEKYEDRVSPVVEVIL